MEYILKRLFENREVLSHFIFSIEDNSEDSWDLYDKIQGIVYAACLKLFGEGINVDDSGLDSSGDIRGERTITYKARIFYYKKNKEVPLNNKEASRLESELEGNIRLPIGDEDYNYEVRVRYDSGRIIINLIKEETL